MGFRCIITLFLVFSLTPTAFAALGGDDASIQADAQAEGVQRKIISHGKYATHEIAPKKFTLHELMASGLAGESGSKVFAVTWSGKAHPNLRRILGDYFQQFESALRDARKTRKGHGSIVVNAGNFHLELGGHQMSIHGRIWLTDQLPQGMDTREIQ